jgi:tRNA uridine 5-carboxymethylaminomethyl modification enzyme
VKFPEAIRHQVFLEPEGLDTSEMYVNGLSTSLPPEVQLAFLRTVHGLEHVRMTRPGYAIEYDYFPPTQLKPTLELRGLPGLFLAGQVNGTTGYEEAAGQGVVAGINAAAAALDREPVTIDRGTAFIGVLVDDLVSRGVDEPYRLFTSRSEYRLTIRQDNALRRMLPLAERLRLLDDGERRAAEGRLQEENDLLAGANESLVEIEEANRILLSSGSTPVREVARVSDLARRPGIPLAALLHAVGLSASDDACHWVEVELRYGGYLARERESARRLAEMQELRIPADVLYGTLRSISSEGREKLARVRPATLAQASRIPGVSASDLQNLVAEVLRRRQLA